MKNALLLFLSKVHLKNKKLALTEYNTENYGKIQSCQTNEASVKYLMKKLANNAEKIDKIFAFSTKLTRTAIDYTDEQNNIVHREMQREIFDESIIQEYPQLDGCIKYIEFDEDCDSRKTIQYVLKMVADMSVAMGNEVAEWTVHTDLTGGMRHATVLMMSVLHLLKYRGINIGDAIYANYYPEDSSKNRIEDVSNIHRMFELVSSTDSFLNYATLREIENYFAKVPKEEKSDKLERLLNALSDFSDAVKVCRTGKFESSLRELADSLDKFKQYSEKSTQEALFAQVLGALEKDYQGIISREISRTDIIRWCIRKEYLQQAMTLFNEWMPTELVKLKILSPSSEYINKIKRLCQAPNKGYKKFENVFIDEFYMSTPRSDKSEDEKKPNNVVGSRKYLASFRTLMKKGGKGEYPDYIDKNILKLIIDEIESTDWIKKLLIEKSIAWSEVQTKYTNLIKCVQYKKNSDSSYRKKRDEDVFISRIITTEKMYKFLAGAPEDFIYELLGIERIQIETVQNNQKKDKDSSKHIEKSWDNRWNQINNMLENKIVNTEVDMETLKKILEGQYWIRKQRNQINHANSSAEVATNDQLKDRMIDVMDLIELIKTE